MTPSNTPELPELPELLTDERILHIVDTHVGGPTPGYPLDCADWINFARAIEQAALSAQSAEIARLTERMEHSQEWYATRHKRLWHWAHEKLSDEQQQEYFSIVANGTADVYEPPTYAQQMNQLKWRVEAAEKEAARLRGEVEALRKEAARYRWIRQLMKVDDIGDETAVWSLAIDVERIEIAASQSKPSASVDGLIDAALAHTQESKNG